MREHYHLLTDATDIRCGEKRKLFIQDCDKGFCPFYQMLITPRHQNLSEIKKKLIKIIRRCRKE